MVRRGWARRRFKPYERKELAHRARAIQLGCQWEPVDFFAIVRASRRICYLCRAYIGPRDLSFDHIVPLSRGGAHIKGNIAVTHKRCNLRKGKKFVSELDWRLASPQG